MEELFYRVTLSEPDSKEANDLFWGLIDKYKTGLGVAVFGTEPMGGDLDGDLKRISKIHRDIVTNDYYDEDSGFDSKDYSSWNIDYFADKFNLSKRSVRKLINFHTDSVYGISVMDVFNTLYDTNRYGLKRPNCNDVWILYDKTIVDDDIILLMISIMSYSLFYMGCEDNTGVEYDGVYIPAKKWNEIYELVKQSSQDKTEGFDLLGAELDMPELNETNTCIYFSDIHVYPTNADIGKEYFGN